MQNEADAGFFGIMNIFHDISSGENPRVFYMTVVCDEKGPRYYFKLHVIPKFLNDMVFDG
jgi:hypothetical protein